MTLSKLDSCLITMNSDFTINSSHRFNPIPAIEDIFKKTMLDSALLVTLTVAAGAFTYLSHSFDSLMVLAGETAYLNLNFRVMQAIFSRLFRREIDETIFAVPTAVNNALFCDATLGTLVHEAGHAWTADLLFKNAKSLIVWLAPSNGVTFYNAATLSKIGSLFGRSTSLFFTVAAGPLAAVVAGSISIAIGLSLRQTHSELATFFAATGFLAIVDHVKYALSALAYVPELAGHDFVALWYFEVHPIAAAVAIVAIPTLCAIAYLAMEQNRRDW